MDFKIVLILVGLGNPGAQYENNRHNIGFKCVDSIAQYYHFPPFKNKFNGLISEHTINGQKICLVKPQTFMNLSGNCVQQLCNFYKVTPDYIILFHDELNLEAGDIRIKQGGSAGGHNGLRSLDQTIGPNYWRIRIGIGRPEDKNMVSNYVLSDFYKVDREWLEPLLGKLNEDIADFWEKDPQQFIMHFKK